jgi:hypothetical protein
MMKKPLIVVSLCAVVLLVLGSSNTVIANEEMPDLIIEDLLIFPGHTPDEEEFRCQVKNIGNASTPYDKDLDISVTIRWKTFGLLPLIQVRKFTGGTGGFSLEPGETIKLPFATSSRMPFFGFYTFYCVVNPEHIIEESNYQNNVYTETVLLILQRSLNYWL